MEKLGQTHQKNTLYAKLRAVEQQVIAGETRYLYLEANIFKAANANIKSATNSGPFSKSHTASSFLSEIFSEKEETLNAIQRKPSQKRKHKCPRKHAINKIPIKKKVRHQRLVNLDKEPLRLSSVILSLSAELRGESGSDKI